MAENEDRSSDDLLDEPSQSKIDELREKGQVPQSRELVGILALLATAGTLYVMAPSMAKSLSEYMTEAFRVDQTMKLNLSSNTVIGQTLLKALKLMVMISLPVCAAGFLAGVIGSYIQVGTIFTLEPLTPSFDKINPLKGIQRLVSMKHVKDSVRILVKVSIGLFVIYSIVKTEIFQSSTHIQNDPETLFAVLGVVGKKAFLALVAIFAVFAVIDWWFQRQDWMKQVRLTKQEAKEESKEKEGNPQIKARVRAIQRDMSRKRMMAAIKTADVIVTNPTHIAIAIKYDNDKMMAPKVVAKGADFLAQRIRKVAQEAGIPLVENVPLARTLYKTVKVNHYVPRALYQAVAEVLAYVYRLKNRMF